MQPVLSEKSNILGRDVVVYAGKIAVAGLDGLCAMKWMRSLKVRIGLCQMQMWPAHFTKFLSNIFLNPCLLEKMRQVPLKSVVIYPAGEVSSPNDGDAAFCGLQHRQDGSEEVRQFASRCLRRRVCSKTGGHGKRVAITPRLACT